MLSMFLKASEPTDEIRLAARKAAINMARLIEGEVDRTMKKMEPGIRKQLEKKGITDEVKIQNRIREVRLQAIEQMMKIFEEKMKCSKKPVNKTV